MGVFVLIVTVIVSICLLYYFFTSYVDKQIKAAETRSEKDNDSLKSTIKKNEADAAVTRDDLSKRIDFLTESLKLINSQLQEEKLNHVQTKSELTNKALLNNI